ncbi:RloB family protein [Flavobacterium soyae]|uniref:RloB family protein n=1 Tax=Flavobacterium soyae TaxID=2903098 RepID=UPI001E458E87|nr:RloB family protein [Flavobacterium soyae]MCD9574863.1 RloB family protein [Flavobacterium soyae]
MNRKKYSLADYNKEQGDRDATKFFIVYEGNVKEPNYFEAFNETFLDRKTAYIHHILENNTGIIGNTPLKLKERIESFINNPPRDIKVTPTFEDKFRLILDVDKHPGEQIIEVKNFCDKLNDAKLFISNYCFEVWLWAHLEDLDKIESTKSSEIKTELGTIQTGIYPFCFMDINLINDAIQRSKIADTNKDSYFPVIKSTKIYLLIEELLQYSIINTPVINPKTV